MKIVLSISLLYQSAAIINGAGYLVQRRRGRGNNAILPPPIPEAVPATDSPSHSLNIKTPQRHLNNPQLKANDSLPLGMVFFPVVLRYLCSTGSVLSLDTRLPMSKSRILLNPRDMTLIW